jgi:septal ring factor EnvC (AmiA/AmiB activator)
MEDPILKAVVLGLLGREGWKFYSQLQKNRQKQVDADKKEISSYRKDLLEETKILKNELKDRDSAIFNLHEERAHFSGVIARYEEQIKGLERDLKRLKNNDIQNKKHIEELLKKNG